MHIAALTAALALGVVLQPHAATPPSSTTPIVVQADRGFHWGDSAIGAGVGFGLALALVGSIALIRPGREPSPSRDRKWRTAKGDRDA